MNLFKEVLFFESTNVFFRSEFVHGFSGTHAINSARVVWILCLVWTLRIPFFDSKRLTGSFAFLSSVETFSCIATFI